MSAAKSAGCAGFISCRRTSRCLGAGNISVRAITQLPRFLDHVVAGAREDACLGDVALVLSLALVLALMLASGWRASR